MEYEKVNGSRDPLYVEDDVPIRDEVARRLRVESVTGHTFPIINGGSLSRGYKSYFLVYDRTGRRTRQETFNPDGKVVQRWLYDSGGKLSEQVIYEESGDVDYRFILIYEGDYWKEKRMYYPNDRMNYRIVGDRLANGGLSGATYYDAAGEIIRSDIYAYNDSGLLVRVDMGWIGNSIYKYDQRDNLMERSKNLPGSSVYGNIDEFVYDDQDLLTEMTQQHSRRISFHLTFF